MAWLASTLILTVLALIHTHIYCCTYSKFSTKIYGYTIRYLKIPLQWKVKVKNFQHRCNVNLWYSKHKNTAIYDHTPSLPHQHSECEIYNITVTAPYQNYVPSKFRVLFCPPQIPEQYTNCTVNSFFSEYFSFPLNCLIPPLLHIHITHP